MDESWTVFSFIANIIWSYVRQNGLDPAAGRTIQHGHISTQALKDRARQKEPDAQTFIIAAVTLTALVITLEHFFTQLHWDVRAFIDKGEGYTTIPL